jgi:acetoacetyl-CoA synthetase
MAEEALWAPSAERIASAQMTEFIRHCAEEHSQRFENYDALYDWSLKEPGAFWSSLWRFCDVIGDRGERALINADDMIKARFFPDAKLNFAENLLRHSGEGDALIFRCETRAQSRWSWDQLRKEVSKQQQAMRAYGIQPGDRIAAMMPNIPETVALMLAATSLGAIWSSCSPDFGVQGVLDRFGQIQPKLFIACDSYFYNGKQQVMVQKLEAIAQKIEADVLIVPFMGGIDDILHAIPKAKSLADFTVPYEPQALEFTRLPFDHPLYILFSSGTTGVPKCITHSAGGTLLQHLKEHSLHADLRAGDKLFYFTTCSWMMWNWLVTGLASGTTLCLYEGSPFAPSGNVLFDYAAEEGITFFGTSAKFIDAVRKADLIPAKTHDLSALRAVASTGSPLSPESFSFVYEGIKPDVHLASISGGTDIVSCFVLGNPIKPVFKGEIQGPGLGMAVEVWDDDGKPVRGEKGELVCTKPFPSQPIGFWNDESGAKYRAAYFERFENIWCHGDFAEVTSHGGIVIHGRSDATLNPGGVRIGTAEIYNVVEQMDEVAEAICIGQDWQGDVRVVLFLRMAEGFTLTADLEAKIRTAIRKGATPRHVPAKIIAVEDIPRTKSGKIVELAVRDIIHGRTVKNQEVLANAQALEGFKNLPQLCDE